MKILLTGATGGIGSAIKKSLKGHEVYAPKGDLSTVKGVKGIPKESYDWLIFAHGFIGEEAEETTFLVNTVSCIAMTKLFMPSKGVIFIASTAGLYGNDKFPVYAASKAAIIMYATSLVKKHPEVAFFTVCPGPTDTKMWRGLGLEGTPQPPSAVADVVHAIMEGGYKSGDIITVRNGQVS